MKVLIHGCSLYNVDIDDYRNETDKLVANVMRVRIDPGTKIIKDSKGTDVQVSATLYYDERNSAPRGVRFLVGQAIVFDGERYRVADVQRFYDSVRLHHQEVALIDG